MTREDDALRTLVGGMLMVGVRGAEPGDTALEEDLAACREARCRGVILFDRDVPTGGERNIRSPEQVRRLIAHLRATLGADTIVAVDQEGGAVERLKASRGFRGGVPAEAFGAMDGAAQDAQARAQAAELASLKIDMNFAPCVDLNLEKKGLIGRSGRAFAADARGVIDAAWRVVRAHHGAGVAPCLKHFPGHGSTAADSHADLPDITQTHSDEELEPYRAMCAQKHDAAPVAVMTGHLLHRGVDAARPASLSCAWTTGALRDRIGFRGVVVTDSLDMRAIRDRHGAGEAAVLAVEAGADLLLDANNMPGEARACPAPEMADAIVAAVREGRLTMDRLRESEARLAALRHWMSAARRG